jgi:hypothetical protein
LMRRLLEEKGLRSPMRVASSEAMTYVCCEDGGEGKWDDKRGS